MSAGTADSPEVCLARVIELRIAANGFIRAELTVKVIASTLAQLNGSFVKSWCYAVEIPPSNGAHERAFPSSR
jgi:hypothetical protein